MSVEDIIVSLEKEISKVKGIVAVKLFNESDKEMLLKIEKEAEEKSLMGLGKVVNTGVVEVLECGLVFVALTSMEFDWGLHPSLILKKGEEVVGEEIRDPKKIEALRNKKEVWFMHRSFVVYKDKIVFPKDIMEKVCHFEIPSIPCEWDCIRCVEGYGRLIFANPSTPADVFLKERYFGGMDERGLGSILIGMVRI